MRLKQYFRDAIVIHEATIKPSIINSCAISLGDVINTAANIRESSDIPSTASQGPPKKDKIIPGS